MKCKRTKNGLLLPTIFEMEFFGVKAIPDNTYYNPNTLEVVERELFSQQEFHTYA
jgi:hypothetical protein